MAENSSGRAIIIAAILVSFSIIGGSFFVASGLEGTRGELEAMTEALGELELAGGAAPARPSRPSNRPDADREYDVELAGACPSMQRATVPRVKMVPVLSLRTRYVKLSPSSLGPR